MHKVDSIVRKRNLWWIAALQDKVVWQAVTLLKAPLTIPTNSRSLMWSDRIE
ncbi:hypothetical protein [Chroococcidiopsis cubana]|uniref:hypothetical protein n=1 Tax=Chroococcidiopsis cubana TaxID=171392 RepID=UPI0013158291|nr:hypothetical protein [Chroococcidiopsis cubana]